MRYECLAYSEEATTIRRITLQIDAETPELAVAEVVNKFGYHPIMVNPLQITAGLGNERIKTKSLLSLYRSLEMLAPVGIVFALSVLADSAPDAFAREIAYKISSTLGVGGRSLQSAIEEIDDIPVFHKRIIGTLVGLPDPTLVWRTLSEMMVARARFSKFQSMLIWRGVMPFILFFVGAQILLSFMAHFLSVANINIKGFSATIIHGINMLSSWPAYTAYGMVTATIIAAVLIVRTNRHARILWENILYQIPYIGTLIREYDSGFVARVVGATWSSGGGAVSLEYAAQVVPRNIVSQQLEEIVTEMRGTSTVHRDWAEAIASCDILLPHVRRTISLALTSDNIPKELLVMGESMMNQSMLKIEALLAEVNAALPAVLMGALDLLIMAISFGLMQGFSMTPYQR